MKRLLIIATLLAVTSAPASAELTSDLTTIYVGQSITFNFTLPPGIVPNFQVYGPDSTGTTEYVARYVAGSVFHSGDGQQAFGGSNLGPVTFTYNTPGDYVATGGADVEASVLTCFSWGCVTFPNSGGGFGLGFINGSENITVLAGVPEPGTWGMLLLGFAGLSFALRQTRHQKSSQLEQTFEYSQLIVLEGFHATTFDHCIADISGSAGSG